MLFYETYFEVSNINRKPFILSQDKIVMKFGQKIWVILVLTKVYKNCPKIKEECYFMKLISKRVISTGNLLFGPKIIMIIKKFGQKKWVGLVLGIVYKNCPKMKEKCYFKKFTSKRVI